MKLSVSQLRRIIKEEVSRMLVMEAGYEDPYKEEKPEYYDPLLGDEPPGYEPPEAKGATKIKTEAKGATNFHKQLQNFIQQYSPRDIDIPYDPKPGRDYTFGNNNELKLKPRLYDAIKNQVGAMKKLEKLFPAGVVSGL